MWDEGDASDDERCSPPPDSDVPSPDEDEPMDGPHTPKASAPSSPTSWSIVKCYKINRDDPLLIFGQVSSKHFES